MATVGSVVNRNFVLQALSTSKDPLRSLPAKTEDVKQLLQGGSATFVQIFRRIDQSAGALGELEDVFGKLSKVLDKVIDVADRGLRNTSLRPKAEAEFRKLAGEFSRILDDVQIEDVDLLNREELSGFLQSLGFDREGAGSVADLFQKFSVKVGEENLADTSIRGRRPLSTYTREEITTSPGGVEPAGTFGAEFSVISYADSTTASPLVSDFDGDGIADVASIGVDGGVGAPSIIKIARGNGDGTFQAAVSFDSGTTLTSLVHGEINGVAGRELFVRDGTANELKVYTFSSGTFSLVATRTLPTGVEAVVGDLDGDARSDIMFNNSGTLTAATYSSGTNTFTNSWTLATTDASARLADFDGDSILDFATINAAATQYMVRSGNGDGTFVTAPQTSTPGTVLTYGVLGDFDNSNGIDLLTYDGGTQMIYYNESVGNGTFNNSVFVAQAPGFTGINGGDSDSDGNLDYNQDGNRDFIVSLGANGSRLYTGNGDGTFAAGPLMGLYGASTQTKSADLADANEDGVLDLVFQSDRDITIRLQNTNSLPPIETVDQVPESKPKELPSLFDPARGIRSKSEAALILEDSRAIKKQLETNKKTVESLRTYLGDALQVVRGAAIGFAQTGEGLVYSRDADQIADLLARSIRDAVPRSSVKAVDSLPAILESYRISREA